MWELKTCIACLSTDVKLFKLDDGDLRKLYKTLTGVEKRNCDELPNYICYICLSSVRRFRVFRVKCQKTCQIIKELTKSTKVTQTILKTLDCKVLGIQPNISIQSDNSNVFIEEVKWSDSKPNITHIPIASWDSNEYSISDTNTNNETEVKHEMDNNEHSFESDNESASPYIETCNDTEKLIEEINKINTSDTEYARVIPLSMDEAKNAFQEQLIAKRTGCFDCGICNKSFLLERRLKKHEKIHDKHLNGEFACEICNAYHRTELLLKRHVEERHMYKYVCHVCNHVTYSKIKAKHHYHSMHHKESKAKEVTNAKHVQKSQDFNTKIEELLTYTPLSQLEQYKIVLDRQISRSYTSSSKKCDMCYKGFRSKAWYENHLKKHDPVISGKLQCDMCKIYLATQKQMLWHMKSSHLYKYDCKICNFVCYNRNRAFIHFKWHKKATYNCQHCQKEFRILSTYHRHIRLMHPALVVCPICGLSFGTEDGLKGHKKNEHTAQELATINTEIDIQSPFYCHECEIQFIGQTAFAAHLQTSRIHLDGKKKRKTLKRGPGRPGCDDVINNGLPTSTNCDVCNLLLPNDVQARKHYESEHPGHEFLKRYMCDICGHTTKSHANLLGHIRNRHSNKKPHACPHCDRRFSAAGNRDRHILVHTGEKPHECPHCNRRFTQRNSCKLHIQTVHMKIPYAPWVKSHRNRRAKQAAASSLVRLGETYQGNVGDDFNKVATVSSASDYDVFIGHNED